MKVFVIPGLGNNSERVKKYIERWPGNISKVEICEFNWSNREKEYSKKFKGLLTRFDSLVKRGGPIVVVGISAGASVAINLLQKRPKDVSRVVCICGRLREGGVSLLRPWWLYKLIYPDFIESVRVCEQNLIQVSKKKVLTISSRFDEVVPLSTTRLQGAREVIIDYPTHSFSIKQILTRILPKYLN